MNRAKLLEQLVEHEGCELKPYRDTSGKWTIGIGRNLDDKGISRREALMMASNDIAEIEPQLEALAVWSTLTDARQRVLADMAFNLGFRGLMKFARMLKALESGDYEAAADEMLASRWAGQVKGRAQTLARMMRTGSDDQSSLTGDRQ
jgi:lysozyme